MKTFYLYSERESVLNHWVSSISRLYDLHRFHSLDALFLAVAEKAPAIILFDYDGDSESVDELLQYIAGSHIKVMAFNGRPLFSDGLRLVQNGVAALLNTYASPYNINQAIKAVLGGNIWLYPEFIQMMIKQNTMSGINGSDKLADLSGRERELAEMVALGMSNKEIAQTADITEQTVKTHLKTVYDKLGVASRLELAIMINNQKPLD